MAGDPKERGFLVIEDGETKFRSTPPLDGKNGNNLTGEFQKLRDLVSAGGWEAIDPNNFPSIAEKMPNYLFVSQLTAIDNMIAAIRRSGYQYPETAPQLATMVVSLMTRKDRLLKEAGVVPTSEVRKASYWANADEINALRYATESGAEGMLDSLFFFGSLPPEEQIMFRIRALTAKIEFLERSTPRIDRGLPNSNGREASFSAVKNAKVEELRQRLNSLWERLLSQEMEKVASDIGL